MDSQSDVKSNGPTSSTDSEKSVGEADETPTCPKCDEVLVRPFKEPSYESFFLVYAQARDNDIHVELEKGIAVLPLLCPECGRMEIYNNPAFGPREPEQPH